MENLEQDPAILVSEERAKLFAPIENRLNALISKSDSQLQIKFENSSYDDQSNKLKGNLSKASSGD